MKINYLKYDFENNDNISIEQVKAFLRIGGNFFHLYKNANENIKKCTLSGYDCNRNTMDFLIKLQQIVYRKNLIKKVAEMCHKYLLIYKKYDRIELLRGVQYKSNREKDERTLFRHKIDFYKFVAYNLTLSGYDKKDLQELITTVY